MQAAGERRVVVGVSGSLGSLAALHRAVTEVHRAGGRLWILLAWEAPLGEMGPRGALASVSLSEECRRAAAHELLSAIDRAFGGTGPGVPAEFFVTRGVPGHALVDMADREEDLLVVGTGRRGLMHRLFAPSVARYCVAHAVCPVLTVPPSPLQQTLESASRGRLDIRELDAQGVGEA